MLIVFKNDLQIWKSGIVFCQTLTFSATANPIMHQSVKLVFIDSDYKTWNMDPDELEEAFKKYSELKASLVLHLL